jgi:hypothetical protein
MYSHLASQFDPYVSRTTMEHVSAIQLYTEASGRLHAQDVFTSGRKLIRYLFYRGVVYFWIIYNALRMTSES